MLLAIGASLLAAGLWLPLKAALAEELMNRAWTAARAGGGAVKPWPWADTWPVARLRLPPSASAGPLIVLAGASGRGLAFAPGLLDGSALPGEPGVAVIAAHRDTHFHELARLALGDRFDIERADGETFTYVVTAIEILDTRTASLRLDAADSVVALVTCYPFDALVPGSTLRYVVTGELAVEDNGTETISRRPFVL
ncbi:MAG TPA: class GN sortase [Gammaproteobacteria bacterium]|nr:class GN sortase [Gammaproteobacteria bacterium]